MNRNPRLARDIIDARRNVHHTPGLGLKGGPCFAMTGARLRRGERDVLRPGRLSRKYDRPAHPLADPEHQGRAPPLRSPVASSGSYTCPTLASRAGLPHMSNCLAHLPSFRRRTLGIAAPSPGSGPGPCETRPGGMPTWSAADIPWEHLCQVADAVIEVYAEDHLSA